MAEISKIEGRRIYIKTRFGEPVVALLKSAGAHWDDSRREWWMATSKRGELDNILAASAETLGVAAAAEKERALERDRANILGRATYENQSYYVVAHGDGQRGAWVRLMLRDGSRTFFKSAAEVEITKEYKRPTTLARLQEFAAQLEAEKDETLPIVEECWECGAQYRTFGNVEDGNMGCRRCD